MIEGSKTMAREVLRYPRLYLRSLRVELNMLYHRLTSSSYSEAYSKHMDWRVARQGREAVGAWTKGKRQFDQLRRRGLSPDSTLLEIGCGTLRAGRFFIDYLEPGNYHGIDVSADAIERGKEVVGRETIDRKEPTVLVNEDLTFEEFDHPFDFVHSIGVFTHLPPETVEEAFRNLPRIMHADSVFYGSFNLSGTVPPGIKFSTKSFDYTEAELRDMAERAGLELEVVDDLQMSRAVPQTTITLRLA